MTLELQNPQSPSGQTLVNKHTGKKTNVIGAAGFVLALIAIITGWIPFVGWVIWTSGLILSFVGVFKTPKDFAIAGLVISLIGIIFLITVYGVILDGADISF